MYRRARAGVCSEVTVYPHDEYLSTVSGGSGSLVPRALLGWEGQRFLAGALPGARIAEVVGRSATDAIRVYIGLTHVDAAARADLAVRELERLGALERSRVVVASPTGMGFLNPYPIEAEELMSGGDVATVVVQYADARSYRATARVPLGAETHRRVLEALRRRLDDRGGDRPEVCVFAESLGAWASLAGLAPAGRRGLRDLGIARGLWVGVPNGARPHERRLFPAERRPDVARVERAEHLPGRGDLALRALRFVLATRPDDPVALFEGPSLAWRPPAGRAPVDGRWYPGVTLVRTLMRIRRATDMRPGVFNPLGHDYRPDLVRLVRTAFGHHDVDDVGLSRVEEWVRGADRERARVEGEALPR